MKYNSFLIIILGLIFIIIELNFFLIIILELKLIIMRWNNLE